MKKIIAVLVLVIAVIAVGAPWVVGAKIEQHMDRVIAQVNQSLGEGVSVREYHRGVFSSMGVLAVSSSTPGQPLLLDVHVAHGPVISKPAFALGLAHVTMRASESEGQSVSSDLAVDLQVSLEQQGVFKTTVSQLDLAQGDDRLTLNGVSLEGDYSMGTHQYRFAGKATGLQHEHAAGGLALDNLTFQVDGQIDAAGELWGVGMGEVRVEQIAVEGPQPTTIKTLAVDFETSRPSTGLLAVQYAIDIGSLSGGGADADGNPPIELKDFAFALRLDNLDEQALKSIASASNDPVMLQQQAMMSVQGLLKRSPKLELSKLAFKFGEDDFSAKADVMLDSQALGDPAVLMMNPPAAIKALTVSANLDMTRAMPERFAALQAKQQGAQFGMPPADIDQMVEQRVAQSRQQIEMMVAQGFINSDGNRLKSTVKMENGQLVVNGNAIPLPF